MLHFFGLWDCAGISRAFGLRADGPGGESLTLEIGPNEAACSPCGYLEYNNAQASVRGWAG